MGIRKMMHEEWKEIVVSKIAKEEKDQEYVLGIDLLEEFDIQPEVSKNALNINNWASNVLTKIIKHNYHLLLHHGCVPKICMITFVR